MTVIHAVSVEPGAMATVCGLDLLPDSPAIYCTGWGRPLQQVCAGVTCTDCETAMGLRQTFPGAPLANPERTTA